MTPVTYALVADGTSDRALLPILRWSLRSVWADGVFTTPTFVARRSRPMIEVVREVRRRYRPRLIFVHRDAESEPLSSRRSEIPSERDLVPVIPVRMTEAWLLIDESALRQAAGNPSGTLPLGLPAHKRLEDVAQPKALLKDLLTRASGLRGRHLRRFDREERVQRLAELITDFSPLLGLPAFREFRRELVRAVDRLRGA